jgi:hypothetical protein
LAKNKNYDRKEKPHRICSRDANEPESGFEPEPKTRKFGKFSNPEPVPDPESDFFKTK